MKNFILGVGRFFINFSVIILIIATVIISFAVGGAVATFDNSGIGFIAGLGTFIVLFIIVVMSNFILYLLLGMHDSFVSMSKSLSIIAQNNAPAHSLAITNSGEEIAQKCPKCGTAYNNGDKFCEECGTKLN